MNCSIYISEINNKCTIYIYRKLQIYNQGKWKPMKYEFSPQAYIHNSIPLRILCTAPSTPYEQYILMVCSSCTNALSHTISREIPKLTFCVATSICISSKLDVRGEQGVLAQCTVLPLRVGSDAKTK